MIRLLTWLLFCYIAYRIVKAMIGKKDQPPDHVQKDSEATTTYRDPVCGLYVSEEDAVVGTLEGQRHYFCSMSCLEKFREQLEHTKP